MKHWGRAHKRLAKILLALDMLSVVTGCSTDGYETGDGRYSYLRADFCMAHVTASKTVNYILTDQGDTVHLATPTTARWLPAADTLCRALAYYDNHTKQVFSLSQVMVTRPMDKTKADSAPTDPLTLESAWIGGGFLNVGFSVKSGKSDEVDTRQTIGLMVDSVKREDNHVSDVTLRMLHGQNNVPQYYTVKGYLSMPIPPEWQQARLTVVANDYRGNLTLIAE